MASRPWNLKVDEQYSPKVTVLIPTYNEGSVIKLKLENLLKLNYPKDLIQYIVIDSASSDETLGEVNDFVNEHPEMKIEVITEKTRSGKAMALNRALEHAVGDVVVVSDADCFLPSDILDKALPYLADPSVGAVAGKETLLNPCQSWITKTETAYRDFAFTTTLGESKFHSTIFFEGGFSAYKRKFLGRFDCATADDSGTALSVVQSKARTIILPETPFFTAFPKSLRGRLIIKMRRAGQMMRVWVKCVKLLWTKKLTYPKRIILPEVFLYFLNPFFFIALVTITFLLILEYPLLLMSLLALLVPKVRFYFMEVVQDNLILLGAVISTVFNKKYVTWIKAEDSRLYITKDLLKSVELI
jgi:cellulose synthase/poly-beta-1,6-N-acetylglucosamine synthase-like glycosyltransferase